ncbi:MAG: S26 family signal peptidase [Prevotella sp.]|jgi:hypothetical protein
MRQFWKFLFVVAASVALMLLLRLFVFGIYQSPVTLRGHVGSGDYVLVNYLDCSHIRHHDLVAFCSDSAAMVLGEVVALPGDTLSLKGGHFVLPKRNCWKWCHCHDCGLYLIDTGAGKQLVFQQAISGKVYRLWHLPW